MVGKKSSGFLHSTGQRRTIDSSKSYALFVKIGSPSDLHTNGTMIVGTGSGPTETRIGNLIKTVSWLDRRRALTLFSIGGLASRIVNIIGRLALVPINIQVFRNWVCEIA